MAWFRKIRAGLVKSPITDFVGEEGHIFFNIETGEFRLSDGVTPHGHPICTCGGGPGGGLTEEEVIELIDDMIDDGDLAEPTVEAEQVIVTGQSGYSPGNGVTILPTPSDLKLGTQELFLNGLRMSEGNSRDYSIDATHINFLNGWELFNDDVINIVYVKED